MASYNDIICPARAWTAIPVATEDTIISPMDDVRLSSNPNGVGGSGIPFNSDRAHLVRANTTLWVLNPRGADTAIARMTA